MAPNVEDLKFQYQTEFKPVDLYDLWKIIWETSQETVEFLLVSVKEMLQSAGLSGRLLDVASGPTVHFVAAASIHFQHIVLSDFVNANRRELKKWLNKESGALNWDPILKVEAEIEKFSNLQAGVKEIEERIRKTVKKVVPCDVTSSTVLPPTENEKQFDCIISSLTLESASSTYENYVKHMKNVTKLIRPGGGFLLLGVTRSSYYEPGKTRFDTVSLTLPQVLEAVNQCGLFTTHLKAFKQRTITEAESYEQIFVSFHVKQ